MRTLVATLLGGALAVSPALAQAPAPKAPAAKPPASAPAAPASGVARPAAPRASEYDAAAELKLTGIVEDFHESQMKGDHPGLHLMVKTETEIVEVHACPVRFMKELEFAIDKGDTLTVTGSRPGGTGTLIARELTKGQTSLILRDKTGSPVWTR